MNIIIAGDYCPHSRVQEYFNNNQFDIFFRECREIVTSSDYSIVNLECPIIRGGEHPIIKQGPNLSCSEKAVEALHWAGFRCITMANNHIYDYGDEGIDNVEKACLKWNLDYVGGGRNIEEASQILYTTVKGHDIAVINCCEHEFSIAGKTSGGANPLDITNQYYAITEAKKHAEFVLIIIHGGIEHFQLPSPRMRDLYRFFIDVGADVVINHHQHCYSGFEYYNEKAIFYGLGNFCFDWPERRSDLWSRGFLLNMVFDKGGVRFETIPFAQCEDNESAIRFLRGTEIAQFNNEIEKLNKIISDPIDLENEYLQLLGKTQSTYTLSLEPYSSKILKGLIRRSLLPSTLSQKRLLRLLDFIECESHRDRLVYSIKQKLKKS